MSDWTPAAGCTLILAAGQGQRYRQHSGEDKLLAPSSNAESTSVPILLATLRACAGLTERCVLVLPDDQPARLKFAEQHAPALGIELLCISSNGLGHSLAQAVAATGSSTGWLVVLADMPYIQTATWQRMAQAIQPHALAAPTFQGRRGHPRIIGSHYASYLRELQGDQGAQELFALSAVQEIAVEDRGILLDIDVPTDRLAP
ncbi:NTP transferase domain-containing protein [Halopseudomonas pelagia]|uniref:Molybdopterin-guanine dinucleotide biosynthesis protein MobA n=1 Tax=Halopseudomonas pelagia TaxID=553151 RepID=A0AA91U351_9GAMM|nr:nucleotidyltransferase family protein [Halopseudomonas pelagia]PCC99613.1 molybdopterin-guanine dinucleotide biosynthesis protein MobA [Halopseudomonas pelagia]QFY57280.1 nucleotidyltransferase family protein [Halopseudomonas pelagia]